MFGVLLKEYTHKTRVGYLSECTGTQIKYYLVVLFKIYICEVWWQQEPPLYCKTKFLSDYHLVFKFFFMFFYISGN